MKKLSFSLKKGTFYRRKKTTRYIIAPFETMTLSADEEFDICVVLLVVLLAIYHNKKSTQATKRLQKIQPKKMQIWKYTHQIYQHDIVAVP